MENCIVEAYMCQNQCVARAFQGGRATHPEDQSEEEN